MPLAMQAKLLRVLEEGEVERIGGDKPIPVDVRVVVATHRDLEDLVGKGVPPGLFHRVYVFPIVLPPLRERRDDIPAARGAFCPAGMRAKRLEAVALLRRCDGRLAMYAWPGNIRELRNVVERLMLLADRRSRPGDAWRWRFLQNIAGRSVSGVIESDLFDRVPAFERETILEELERNRGHITNTAKALGLERSHLYKKCQQLGIELRQSEKERP